MKKLLFVAVLLVATAAQAEQHDFGNGNCRSCNGGVWSPSQDTPGNWVCSGTAGPLEICGKAIMGSVTKNPIIEGGGPRRAITSSPAASKRLAK